MNDRTKGFNNYWGQGDYGTVFTENDSYGYMSRQKGLPKKTMMASFLDPRTKDMATMDELDIVPLVALIRGEMLRSEKELQEISNHCAPLLPVGLPSMLPRSDDPLPFFDKLRRSSAVRLPPPVDPDFAIIQRVNVELENYQLSTPSTHIMEQNADDSWYCTNPLLWWKAHQVHFPILSRLARGILCIPATSAPSERVFSMAELTISKLRASLSSDHASSMIFLHDVWDIAEEFQNKKAKLSGEKQPNIVF